MLRTALVLATLLGSLPVRADAPPTIPNPKIDYQTYLRRAAETEALRASRRVTEAEFARLAAEPGTVVLDARSADKYRLRHIRGAVSLPFTDFTASELARVIPSKTSRVLIYCNNNFEGDERAFATKAAPASLNISTFVSLVIYGYRNVYELGPMIDVEHTTLVLEGE